MSKEQSVKKMTDVMAKFVAYTGKVLPDDVRTKLAELREKETGELAKTIYDAMFKNQGAGEDTGPSQLPGYRECCSSS